MANNVTLRSKNGKFQTDPEIKEKLDVIDREDVFELAKRFVTVKELADFYGIPYTIFYNHFRDTVRAAYLETRISLKTTIFEKAMAGDKWAMNRLATTLGFVEDGKFDYEIPPEEQQMTPDELTQELRRVK